MYITSNNDEVKYIIKNVIIKKINGDKSVERVRTSKKLKLQTENDMIPNELRQQKQDNPPAKPTCCKRYPF